MPRAPRPATHAHPFAGLARARQVSLTTFRKTGVPVVTPVWFALDGGVIYVETGPNQFVRRRIVLGASHGDRTEIIDGLRPNDKVVVGGAFKLKATERQEKGEDEAATNLPGRVTGVIR